MVHLEFSLDAPVGGFSVVVSTIQMLHWKFMSPLLTLSGVLLKMEVGIPKGAWRRAWRYPAYLWSLRWVYVVKKTRRLVYGVYPRIPPNTPLLTLRRNVPAPNRPHRVGPAPNCPVAELAAPSCPRPYRYNPHTKTPGLDRWPWPVYHTEHPPRNSTRYVTQRVCLAPVTASKPRPFARYIYW